MLDTDIRKPTGPNSGEGEKSFFSDEPPVFSDLSVGLAHCAWPETFVVYDEVA